MYNENQDTNPNRIQLTLDNIQVYYEQPNQSPSANQSEQLMPPEAKHIRLVHGDTTYEIRAELVKFSQLLGFCYEFDEITNGKEGEDEGWLKIDIPNEIPVNQQIILIVSQFMHVCSYDPAIVKLGKVKPYSVKPNNACPQIISKFITNQIKNLPNPFLNQLIQFCRYLQINPLLQVIYFHLATKYCCPYSDKQAQGLMDKYKVKKLNSDDAFELKQKYFYYFQNLGRKFLEIEEERKLEADKLIEEKK